MRDLVAELKIHNPDLIAKALAIDAKTVERGLHELARRQSGWLGIPEEELLPEAERLTAEYVARRI